MPWTILKLSEEKKLARFWCEFEEMALWKMLMVRQWRAGYQMLSFYKSWSKQSWNLNLKIFFYTKSFVNYGSFNFKTPQERLAKKWRFQLKGMIIKCPKISLHVNRTLHLKPNFGCCLRLLKLGLRISPAGLPITPGSQRRIEATFGGKLFLRGAGIR